MDSSIIYQVEERIATITLNRPDKRNALSGELIVALGLTLEEAAADDRVRVVILTGAGSAFSAGLDLEELRRLRDNTALENEADARRLADLYTQIYLHPKPVIAKINGHAVAGGCGLAAACDISVAVEEAKIGFTEVRIGFVPAIVSVFALRRIRETEARNLLLRGHLISAVEAVTYGLITMAVPPEELDEEVAYIANEIATETSASAVALTKRMLAQLPGMGFQEALAYAAQVNAFARGTEDCKAGIDAFLNKTPAPWKR
ncbi:MAG: enoyl-CoA hydratase-related protein [Rhodothermales bacterium]